MAQQLPALRFHKTVLWKRRALWSLLFFFGTGPFLEKAPLVLLVHAQRICPSKTYTSLEDGRFDTTCEIIDGPLEIEGYIGLKYLQFPRLLEIRGRLKIVNNPDLVSIYAPLLKKVDQREERSILIQHNGLGYMVTSTTPR